MGSGTPAHGEQILESSPLLVVLGSHTDTPADWLATGQALQRVLLRACASGLQASFLNQPLHLPEFRDKVARLVPEVTMPQLLLRLGRPRDDLAPVLRRPLEQVLDVDWVGH